MWLFIVYFLNSIAAAPGQSDILFAASINILGLVFGIVGATLGAIFGARAAGCSLSPLQNNAEVVTESTDSPQLLTIFIVLLTNCIVPSH